MLVIIRGAGDIASGIALRLYRAHMKIIMTETATPTAIRRTISFSECVFNGTSEVEGVTAQLAKTASEAKALAQAGKIGVVIDETLESILSLKPDVVVDAILAKHNLGTTLSCAPVVIGVGPGFTVGKDCHAAVETIRGHYLGRALYLGSPLPNTGVPGEIGGFSTQRVLRSPADGVFTPILSIGDIVKAGDIAGMVNGVPMPCTIDGTLRGILPQGISVKQGMKSGDIDPRCEKAHCNTASDKALSVGGGVLEAILNLSHILED